VIGAASLRRFVHPERAQGQRDGQGAADSAAGFALVLPWGEHRVPLATVKLSLRLKSGSRLPLWQGQPAPADSAVVGRVLATLPATVSGAAIIGNDADEAVAEVLEPWLRPEQEHRAAQVTAHELVSFGAPAEGAEVSIVIPLGDDPQLLRCTLTTLAMASPSHLVEIVFAADRARVRLDQVRLLRGLAVAFGLSGRLAVIDRTAGPGSLLNGGAAAANAPVLVLLGAGVIAEQPGWLGRLAGALERAGGNCVAGARILGEDQGIRDAGLTLDVDALGRLDLAARFDGFPRGYPETAEARCVDAVSAAAIAMPRHLFDKAGGFDDRYLSPRYREADFCLEVRRQGGRVLALPDPVLFDLGGGGSGLAPTARAAAATLDRRLFEERWRDPNVSAYANGGPAEPASGDPLIGNTQIGVAA
jgi:hypothetical protein